MAIVRGENIFPIDQFVAGLEKARVSVVRIYAERPLQSLCTGWFITPQLIVTVGFDFEHVRKKFPEAEFWVESYDENGSIHQEQIAGAPELLGHGLYRPVRSAPMLALLRLPTTANERALDLSFDPRKEGEWISVIQFPEGKPVAGISFGRISALEDPLMAYDANTVPGSSGGPVFDHAWRVAAVHIAYDVDRRLNQGITRAALVTALRGSTAWGQIARHHRIADDRAAQVQLSSSVSATEIEAPDPILVRAAVSESLDRHTLSDDEKSRLRTHVADSDAARLVLRPSERRSIITAVGSIDKLKAFRRPSDRHNVFERVVDDILNGPPYDLSSADEESLACWIQATRWFDGVVPDLPSSAQVAQRLERRRMRSRLERVAGPGFCGRKRELGTFRNWFAAGKGPLVLTGVGGIGKSALVARFVSELPPETLLLWLDFDRADLAPDDAVSVLTAIADQAAVQLDHFEKPPIDKSAWETSATALGKQLKKAIESRYPPLLVLDSFEAAQYAERYYELWPVLERISSSVPALRVIVTGRAPVPSLELGGRWSVPVHLKGLHPDDARAWLQDKGITAPTVLDRVLTLADGIPLVLQLASRLVETGGQVEDLPNDLPTAIVAGYLHDRILDRVSPALKSVITGALVLRRLTEPMVIPVLGDLDGLTLPLGEVSEWFPELRREMAIVEGSDVLRVRPEVRSATLELLERDRVRFVRTIDERAVQWYASQDASDPEIAAELVYHRLRLGDVYGAEQAWRDGTGAFLMYAEDEIRDRAARLWLHNRLAPGTEGSRPVDAWEQDAAERIRSVRARGLDRAVGKILSERPDRSNSSPLVFHEAFELRAAGQSKAASKFLEDAGESSGAVGRERAVLRALLASDLGDRRTADQLLTTVDDLSHWTDRRFGVIEALAVQASRVRLATNVDLEIELLGKIQKAKDWDPVKKALSPLDVVLPRLKLRLRTGRPALESNTETIDLAIDPARVNLLQRVEGERTITLPEEPPNARQRRHELLAKWERSEAWHDPDLRPADFKLRSLRYGEVSKLAELGWRRWWFASTRPFLARAYELCRNRTEASPLVTSILGTLALFALRYGNLRFGNDEMSLGEVIQANPAAHETLHMTPDAWDRVEKLLKAGVDPEHRWTDCVRDTDQGDVVVLLGELLNAKVPMARYPVALGPFLLSLVVPDPLPQLAADLAGQSERTVLTSAMLE